jgi:hypothetical protein
VSEPIEHDMQDEMELANFIILRRINDVLMLLLKNTNPQDADAIAKMHEQGIFISPPPAWQPGTDE